LIAEGIGLVWESYKLDPYVQKLAELVTLFQEKVDDLLVLEEQNLKYNRIALIRHQCRKKLSYATIDI